MSEKSFSAAINEALDEELERNERVYLAGEDIGEYGGVFGVTRGLQEKYGEERVRDTPLSEIAIAGHGFGAAVGGLRPVIELQFADFLATAGDETVNQIAKQPYVSGGRLEAPLTIRAPSGAGVGAAAQHSASVQAWVGHQAGLVVVAPSTPYDAKGLLKSAIRDDNPVIFLEHKALYGAKEEVPDDEYTLALGEAAVEQTGSDVTVVASQQMYHRTVEAADELAEEIDIEIVNPRTFAPLDMETIYESVRKTSRLVVVDETPLRYGTQTHIAGKVATEAFWSLDAPPRVLGVDDVPIPFSPVLEEEVLPSTDEIIDAIRSVF
ncbi:alpha-ketoacid dehydrogenase subunit beta [Haloarchaeobius sp. DYHT-AS-18]|uniref:alpha-ketoacid dehydrogenase subunit beta n=1 Tax=Haloarchaeobius sp. DYHT-AS-18 TaxID=3446117 RepID=UPI003EB98400